MNFYFASSKPGTHARSSSFIRNIQVDNPVAVLDQEESKKFLTGKPADKVRNQFFLASHHCQNFVSFALFGAV